ncbi:MAG: Ger(x)C family spore germination protein [Dethiobacter sp.]|jgi:spore germination protein KC|nr:Ger(x)C family spore germination protein [Dethiobacter sp.]
MGSRRLPICLLLLLPLFFLPGCWSQVEIDDLAIVRAIAIDYLPDRRAPFLVTMDVIRPGDIAGGGDAGGGGGGGGSPTRLFTGNGATIDLAIQQASFNISRRIFLSHNELVLVSEDMAKHGLHSVMDFIMRDNQMRLTNFVLVAPGMAHDILAAPERLETGIADEILGLLAQARTSSEADPQEAYRMQRQMSTPGQDTHAPVLRISPHLTEVIPEFREEMMEQGQDEGSQESQGQGAGGAEEQVVPQKELTLAGAAVFCGDVLRGFLDPIETRGFLLLKNGVKLAAIVVPDPLNPEKKVVLTVSRAQATITPVLSGGKVSFSIEVVAEGDLASQRSESDLSAPEMLKKLGSAKAAAIKIEIEKALQKLQELESDIVGFGAILNRSHPQVFREIGENWPQVFTQLEFDIHVTAHIRRTGQLSRPAPINR